MSLSSLATSAQTSQLASQIAAVYDFLAANVQPLLCNHGSDTPPVENQAIPWIKTFSDGTLDGVFVFDPTNKSWFTRMSDQVGRIGIFVSTAHLGLGWEVIANNTIGIAFAAGYEAREFTGVGLMIVGQFAYRRFDQPITS
jgi:hypothetical protein